MEPSGQQAQTTIFAANGAARHRMVRAAIVAGFALLAAWAVALALGVMGGFGSLPLLPSVHSHASSDSGSTPAPAHAALPRHSAPALAVHVQRATRTAVQGSGGISGRRPVTARHPAKPSSPAGTQKVTGSQGRGATHVSTSSGKGYGTTRTTLGKPTGTPGKASGGSGAPGKLR